MAVLCTACARRRFDPEELPPVRTARRENCQFCGTLDPGGNYTMPDFQVPGSPDDMAIQDPDGTGGGGGGRSGGGRGDVISAKEAMKRGL
jgi:hypothetical protein